MRTKNHPLKPIPTRELYADSVMEVPRDFSYESENFDECENDVGWRYILPDWSDMTIAAIRESLEDHGLDCNREDDEDHDEYEERLRQEANDFCAEHQGEIGIEPLMSYFYPINCDFRVKVGDKCEKISENHAQAILMAYGGAVCLVQVDGEAGIALTGGGMDLSWDICEAYVLLGFLPPAHFELPEFAGQESSPRNLRIVAACRRSYGRARCWMAQKLQKLRHTQSRLVEPTKRK